VKQGQILDYLLAPWRETTQRDDWNVDPEGPRCRGKAKGAEKRKPIFETLPEAKMTFNELANWYLDIEKIKTLSYYPTLKTCRRDPLWTIEEGRFHLPRSAAHV
jgi:hypothetical protein